jgi:hypothetical protein
LHRRTIAAKVTDAAIFIINKRLKSKYTRVLWDALHHQQIGCIGPQGGTIVRDTLLQPLPCSWPC